MAAAALAAARGNLEFYRSRSAAKPGHDLSELIRLEIVELGRTAEKYPEIAHDLRPVADDMAALLSEGR